MMMMNERTNKSLLITDSELERIESTFLAQFLQSLLKPSLISCSLRKYA